MCETIGPEQPEGVLTSAEAFVTAEPIPRQSCPSPHPRCPCMAIAGSARPPRSCAMSRSMGASTSRQPVLRFRSSLSGGEGRLASTCLRLVQSSPDRRRRRGGGIGVVALTAIGVGSARGCGLVTECRIPRTLGQGSMMSLDAQRHGRHRCQGPCDGVPSSRPGPTCHQRAQVGDAS